jgi:hypothetical protein
MRKLFCQFTASDDFGFYCLLFPNAIHNRMTAGMTGSSKQITRHSTHPWQVARLQPERAIRQRKTRL